MQDKKINSIYRGEDLKIAAAHSRDFSRELAAAPFI
jgi:hypothetical protein